MVKSPTVADGRFESYTPVEEEKQQSLNSLAYPYFPCLELDYCPYFLGWSIDLASGLQSTAASDRPAGGESSLQSRARTPVWMFIC